MTTASQRTGSHSQMAGRCSAHWECQCRLRRQRGMRWRPSPANQPTWTTTTEQTLGLATPHKGSCAAERSAKCFCQVYFRITHSHGGFEKFRRSAFIVTFVRAVWVLRLGQFIRTPLCDEVRLLLDPRTSEPVYGRGSHTSPSVKLNTMVWAVWAYLQCRCRVPRFT